MDGSAAIGVDETLTRTTNPAATDKIAELRRLIATPEAEGNWGNSTRWELICDILQDLNEVPLYRG